MLILTLASSRIAKAEVDLKPWSCLDREHKEQVEICFEQNSACHQALQKSETVATDWELLGLSLASGLVAGILFEQHFRH
jgi:hypothetical protein